MNNSRKFGSIFLLGLFLILVVSGNYQPNATASDNLSPTLSSNLPNVGMSDDLRRFFKVVLPGENSAVAIADIQDLLKNPSPKPALPSPSLPPANYTVVSGDTLWNIANTYHMTVEQLVALNGLNDVALSIGQKLVVSGQAQLKPGTAAQPAATPSRSTQPSQAQAVLQLASQYLNTPYKWGGTTPGGFDCSGFVQYVYGRFGYSLPRTAAEQATVGVRVDKANLKPGDLVFFAYSGSGISHVGIYAGNGRYINASTPHDGGVIYSSLSASGGSYVGARRILR